jgi:peptide/nickel transport system permease protein
MILPAQPRRLFALWVGVLGAMHVAIICAGFLAPYDPAAQDRDHPDAPPTRLHWRDAQGRFHLRPFIYALESKENAFGEYQEDHSHPLPLRFFLTGAPYRLLGVFPSRLHLFGAPGVKLFLWGSDGYGRDLFSRVLYGGQISLLAGALATALALGLGFSIGAVAGFLGGWTDDALMRFAELFLALPWLYLLFAIRAFLPLSLAPLRAFLLVVLVIGAVGWARPARLVRGVVLSAKQRDYVRAARGFGAGPLYLLHRHILPQTAGVVYTQAALLIPQYILAEVTLSFLGLGVPEPVASWGNLLAGAQQYTVLAAYWWMLLPALAMLPFLLGYLGLASTLQKRSEASPL